MKKNKYAICVPLSGEVLKYANNITNSLAKKYSINFINNKKSRPHINLFSGLTSTNLDKFSKSIKRNLKLVKLKNEKFKIPGLGIFLGKLPLIYLRFETPNNINKLRKLFYKSKNIWSEIDSNVSFEKWVPKSTLVFKDLKIKDLSKVSNFILKNKIPKEMKINEIVIIDFSAEEEKEIKVFKLIK